MAAEEAVWELVSDARNGHFQSDFQVKVNSPSCEIFPTPRAPASSGTRERWRVCVLGCLQSQCRLNRYFSFRALDCGKFR
jgi:hypothetical protein